MNTHPTLEEALALALRLAPKERLQLIEQVASSVEREMETPLSRDNYAPEHWGQALNRLMDEIGSIEMKHDEIEDPVEWLKHLRAENRRRRLVSDGGQDITDEVDN